MSWVKINVLFTLISPVPLFTTVATRTCKITYTLWVLFPLGSNGLGEYLANRRRGLQSAQTSQNSHKSPGGSLRLLQPFPCLWEVSGSCSELEPNLRLLEDGTLWKATSGHEHKMKTLS